MKVTQMPPVHMGLARPQVVNKIWLTYLLVHAENLVAKSGNPAYGVDVIKLQSLVWVTSTMATRGPF